MRLRLSGRRGPARIRRSIAGVLLCPLLAILASSGDLPAEQLPIAHFTQDQGLGHLSVHCALEDRHGYLWFCTGAGLSRFDGQTFRNFPSIDDLEPRFLVEEDGGGFVVGTFGAAYHFDPADGGRFERILKLPWRYLAVTLLRDDEGGIWAGADRLYRLERKNGEPVFQPAASFLAPGEPIAALAQDRHGTIWIGGGSLHGITRSGRFVSAILPPGLQGLLSLAVDAGNRVWAESPRGICRMDPFDEREGIAEPECRLLPGEGRRPRGTHLLARAGSGVWIGGHSGLVELDGEGRVIRTIGSDQGLPKSWAYPLLVDSGGRLWATIVHDGAARLDLSGFTTFGPPDGLQRMTISSLLRARSGELVVVGSGHAIYARIGDRFVPITPDLEKVVQTGWGWNQYELQDREGDWWIPTDQGIYRYAAVERLEDLRGRPPKAHYTRKDGLPSDSIWRLFEDSRGDLWLSVLYPPNESRRGRPALVRWERASGRFVALGRDEGVPEQGVPMAFAEMPDGTLWIGFSEAGEVYRVRGGRFERLGGGSAPLARGHVSAIHRDRGGRVWIATRGAGVCRIDDPEAGDPACVRLTIRDGLASDIVNGFAEDAGGRLYLGGGNGVDLLEEGRPIRHLGRAEGLPRSYVNVVLGDPDLGLWFGTLNGLARLTPSSAPAAAAPPAVRIDGLRVAGVARSVSALGETAIRDLVLRPDEGRLQIDLVGVSLGAGESVRFQHRMAAADPWSEPSPARTLLLPSLSPGRHRVEIRAIDAAGRASPESAVLSFRLLAPIWMRPWFQGIVALAVLAGVLAAWRARLAHHLALERQRMRIAMDLHDELGSGLGSIGVLADLAADETVGQARRHELLEEVASTASELGRSMGDIVRSLRSGSEPIESLARHLSERGRRLFPGGGPTLETSFPPAWPPSTLSLGTRHAATMIGLEALHNAARHSGATRVRLELAPVNGRWRLAVSDDGRGMPEEISNGGMGLTAMKRRAGEIGAELSIESSPGGGTVVSLLFDPAAVPGGGVR